MVTRPLRPWKLAKDPGNRGKTEEWFKRGPVSDAVEQKIPNPLQLAFPGYNGVAWYWRSFEVPNPEALTIFAFALKAPTILPRHG